MRSPKLAVGTLDCSQVNGTNSLLPSPSVLCSLGWKDIHYTIHVIACKIPYTQTEKRLNCSSGERWLDSKLKTERRNIGDIVIIPADISHRCNWNTSVQFMLLAIEPELLKQVGIDWVNSDRIELISQFMMLQDALIQGIFSTLGDRTLYFFRQFLSNHYANSR